MKQSWYAELEREHGEQLVLLERIELALQALDLEKARDLVGELDRKLAEHLAYEEEVLRLHVEKLMLPEEVLTLDELEREHVGLLGGMTSLRYGVAGVTPGPHLEAALAFIHAFRHHTLSEQRLLRGVNERLTTVRAS